MEALSALGRFRGTDTESVEFPATLNNRERAFVHKHCKLLGLNSKSHGAGESRRLVVTRKSVLGPKSSRVPTFTLRDESLARLREHLRSNPISKSDLSTPTSAVSAGNRHRIRASVLNPSMGGDGTLAAPPADARAAWRSDQKALKSRRGMDAILGGRHALPSWSARDDVTRALRESNVVVVSGETGTGKSTQVPQFILDDELSGPTANIIVTQPRRLSATSLAERVAFERGERVGETVGYNVRLDNATSSRTRLLFCTTGVILRRVTSDPALAGVTHLIIDEAHERDVNSDFLLAILRDVLPLRPDLRVLVMSATIHLQLFVDFFARRGVAGPTPAPSLPAPDAAAASASAAADHDADAPPSTARPRCVFIRGTTHRVTRFFLNDVLVQTGYMEAAVRRAKARKGGGAKAASGAGPTAAAGDGSALAEAAMAEDEAGEEAVDPASFFDCPSCQAYGFKSVDEYASHVATCFGPENPGEGGTRGGRRPDTGAAAGSAPVSGVEELDAEEDGAPPAMFIDPVAAAAAATAAEAESASGSGAAAAASSAAPAADASGFALPTGVKGRDADAAEEGVSPLVATYQKGKGDQLERVDASLVAALVKHIYVNSGPGSALWRERRDSGAADASSLGAILVFLPGWEDITAVRDALRSDALLGDDSRAQILALHSAVPGREQRRVFQRPPAGVLKVVLSTNIAETSLTIDDGETAPGMPPASLAERLLPLAPRPAAAARCRRQTPRPGHAPLDRPSPGPQWCTSSTPASTSRRATTPTPASPPSQRAGSPRRRPGSAPAARGASARASATTSSRSAGTRACRGSRRQRSSAPRSTSSAFRSSCSSASGASRPGPATSRRASRTSERRRPPPPSWTGPWSRPPSWPWTPPCSSSATSAPQTSTPPPPPSGSPRSARPWRSSRCPRAWAR